MKNGTHLITAFFRVLLVVGVISIVAERKALPEVATTTSQPTTVKAASTTPLRRRSPFRKRSEFHRDDALPGVVELSNGRRIAGGVYTTRDRPWKVWVRAEKRWRRIPPAAVLSISANVVQEEMKLRWRWKGMGEPEKVYTGKSYPFRRFLWRFRLADGSEIIGEVKGQPVWIETPDNIPEKNFGPFLLQERQKGNDGQSLRDLVYIRKIVISRRSMENVRAARGR